MAATETLRAAAEKLRELATADGITPGPWLSMDHGDRLLWDGPGAEDLPPRYVVDEPMSNGANAELIATLHPGVAVALADWLGCLAVLDPSERGGVVCGWCGADHAAVVAAVVLGLVERETGAEPSAPPESP